MLGHHHLGLTTVSLLVAILAAYTALDLSGRVSAAKGRARRPWLLGGSLAMGVGVWSMHLLGMLSFHPPVPIRHDLPTWVASVTIAVVASLLALIVVRGESAAAEARYRRLAEASPYGIFICDAAGRLLELNPAAEQIFAADPLVGRPLTALLEPADEPRFAGALAALVRESCPIETEARIRRSGGEERLLALTLTHLREGEAQAAIHGMARDVTVERQRDQQLRRAERLAGVGTLVGGVAHELNNPLTAIRSFAEIMLLDDHPAEDREALEIMRHEADRAARIVADLRLLARATKDDQAGGRTLVDLNEVVRHVLTLRRYTLETHDVEVVLELSPTPARVWGDRGRLEQVVLNLVVNAGHALEARSGTRRLTLRTRADDGRLLLEVADTGIGIRAVDVERIFDPFWTTRAPGEGTGLGLSLVYSIVSDHHGVIRVQSEPDRGTTFQVDFPHPPRAVVEAAPEVEDPTRAPQPLRVLVVDDESSIRLSLERYLERRGHRVDSASEGGEALRLLDGDEGAGYDVILSDLRMPGLAGDELLQELKRRGTGLDRRIVFMSGDAASMRAATLLEDSAVPVVYKPFSLADLAGVLEEFAESAAAAPAAG